MEISIRYLRLNEDTSIKNFDGEEILQYREYPPGVYPQHLIEINFLFFPTILKKRNYSPNQRYNFLYLDSNYFARKETERRLGFHSRALQSARGPARDIQNMLGHLNHALAPDDYAGGRVWIEDDEVRLHGPIGSEHARLGAAGRSPLFPGGAARGQYMGARNFCSTDGATPCLRPNSSRRHSE